MTLSNLKWQPVHVQTLPLTMWYHLLAILILLSEFVTSTIMLRLTCMVSNKPRVRHHTYRFIWYLTDLMHITSLYGSKVILSFTLANYGVHITSKSHVFFLFHCELCFICSVLSIALLKISTSMWDIIVLHTVYPFGNSYKLNMASSFCSGVHVTSKAPNALSLQMIFFFCFIIMCFS